MRPPRYSGRFVSVFLAGAGLGLSLAACEPTNQGYAPPQPVQYSHAVHAGGLRIPCLYCHYGAERGRHAGIPPAAVCLNCHRQVLPDHPEVLKVRTAVDAGKPIEWNRIHQLPDHAYFNHQAHAKAGVACQTCHGPVEQMGRVAQNAPLTMGWCLGCHRKGSERAGAGFGTIPAAQANRLTDCAVCHH
jgi:hypothetical protein